MSKYSKLFCIIKQINEAGGSVTKESLVRDFTDGRTTSLNDLSFAEFQELERKLVQMAPNKKTADHYTSDPLNNTRRAIIAHFKSIGGTTEQAIAWAEKYGVNGNKRQFNEYDGQELFILLQNAKKVKRDHIKSVTKKLSKKV